MDESSRLFLITFPFLFVGTLLVISTVLTLFSGWFGLQGRYPDRDVPALLRLRRQGAQMGRWPGVAMNGILTLDACDEGMRVTISRIFAPFGWPFLVPWSQIRAEPVRTPFTPRVRLRFGDPQHGVMTIEARSWERLLAESRGDFGYEVTPRTPERRVVRGMLLEWLAFTTIAALFFALMPWLNGRPEAGPPIAVAILFPALLFGGVQLVRYWKQRD